MDVTPFQFLTDDDLKLLTQKASRERFERNELILKEGSTRRAVFIVRQGMVRVERSHLGEGVAYARLGTGEIFGEMSFLENTGASASVYADDLVEVDICEGEHVTALMTSVSGFAVRFYQSLAVVLAHRLRETSMLIPPLMVEEVPQVNRFHAPRTGLIHTRDLPTSLTDAARNFSRVMVRIDLDIKENDISPNAAQAAVIKACDDVLEALSVSAKKYPGMEDGIGAYLFRETFPFFMQSRRFDRAYAKPRGYAGDFATIDLLCGDEPEGDGRLGPLVDRWLMTRPFIKSLAGLRALTRQCIVDFAGNTSAEEPLNVTSLASGSAAEFIELAAEQSVPNLHITCVDIDSEALRYAVEHAERRKVSGTFSLLQENILRLSLGKGKIILPAQDMIFCTGFADYVEDRFVVLLLNWMFGHLKEGGKVFLGNVGVDNKDRLFLDHIMEWMLIHRSPEDLRRLFAESSFGLRPVDIKADDTGVQLTAVCTKE